MNDDVGLKERLRQRLSGTGGITSSPSTAKAGLKTRLVSLESGGEDFAARAAQMSPMDLSGARAKNDAFGAYLREEAKKPRPGETDAEREVRLYGKLSEGREPVHPVEGLLRAGWQGLSFGTMDELAGAAKALNPKSGGSYGDRYDAYLARERAKLKQFREESPVLAYGAEIVGSLPTAIVTGPSYGAAKSLMGEAGKQALVGGLQAGAYGFAAGEGDVTDRAVNAAQAAPIGGALAGVAVPAVAGVRAVAGRVADKVARTKAAQNQTRDMPGGGLTREQYERLAVPFRDDPDAVLEGAKRIRYLGDDAMLADAAPHYDVALDAAIQRSGPGGVQATKAIEARASNANQTLTGALDDALGEPEGIIAQLRGSRQATAGARQDAYDAAYSKAIDYSSDQGRAIEETLARIPDRVKSEAIEKANARMKWDGKQSSQIMADVADDGTVTFQEMPNVIQLDYVKRALGDMGWDGVNSINGPTGEQLLYRDMATGLRDAMKEAVPEYSDALRIAGDAISVRESLMFGLDVLKGKTTREGVEEFLKGKGPAEVTAIKKTLRQTIDDMVANVSRTALDDNTTAREALSTLKNLSSRATREKLEMLLGKKDTARLLTEVSRASRALELRGNVARNSATYRRQAMDGRDADAAAPGVVGELARGNPLEAARRGIQAITGQTPQAQRRAMDAVDQRMVGLLVGTRGDDAARLAEGIGRTANMGPRVRSGAGNLGLGTLSRPAPSAAELWEQPRRVFGVRRRP